MTSSFNPSQGEALERYVVGRVVDPSDPHRQFGYIVLDQDHMKFPSVHLWESIELAQCDADSRNEAVAIQARWPHQDDPEVQAILKSPEFHLDETLTFAYAVHQACETVARQRAGLGVTNAGD